MNQAFEEREPDREETKEGFVAKAIETQTAKLPSDTFLWLALGAIGGALALRLLDRRQDALFVGEWAPTFLALGLYNKLVKVAGSDRSEDHSVGHAMG